ncbi:MAG: toll/interleukin-1 receptor domain-containing protein [Beijerinckiaceae bacterium]|nr:toll/interleukin-1 receptor domain-containing protein [Beijerinckiaceae bacterium]
MNRRIFVSYSTLDAKIINVIVHELRSLGLEVWHDTRDIRVNDDIRGVIETVLSKGTDLFLVCLSNNSLASPWVQWESNVAEQAQRLGASLDIVYANISPNTSVPDEIKRKRYVDLSKKSDIHRSLLELAKFLLARSPFAWLGVYNVYANYSDLAARRENITGHTPCDVDAFIECASKSVIAVGYIFRTLFGNSHGRGICRRLRESSSFQMQFYVPDPQLDGAAHLASIHIRKASIPREIQAFVEHFLDWGQSMKLTPQQAARCHLHLMKAAPTHSLLAVDPCLPQGRIIVDAYAFGGEPRDQLKVELRYPQTQLYSFYIQALTEQTVAENISQSMTTSCV